MPKFQIRQEVRIVNCCEHNGEIGTITDQYSNGYYVKCGQSHSIWFAESQLVSTKSPATPELKVGDRVQINVEPFKGLFGEIVGIVNFSSGPPKNYYRVAPDGEYGAYGTYYKSELTTFPKVPTQIQTGDKVKILPCANSKWSGMIGIVGKPGYASNGFHIRNLPHSSSFIGPWFALNELEWVPPPQTSELRIGDFVKILPCAGSNWEGMTGEVSGLYISPEGTKGYHVKGLSREHKKSGHGVITPWFAYFELQKVESLTANEFQVGDIVHIIEVRNTGLNVSFLNRLGKIRGSDGDNGYLRVTVDDKYFILHPKVLKLVERPTSPTPPITEFQVGDLVKVMYSIYGGSKGKIKLIKSINGKSCHFLEDVSDSCGFHAEQLFLIQKAEPVLKKYDWVTINLPGTRFHKCWGQVINYNDFGNMCNVRVETTERDEYIWFKSDHLLIAKDITPQPLIGLFPIKHKSFMERYSL